MDNIATYEQGKSALLFSLSLLDAIIKDGEKNDKKSMFNKIIKADEPADQGWVDMIVKVAEELDRRLLRMKKMRIHLTNGEKVNMCCGIYKELA